MATLALGAPYRRLWSATLLSNLGDGVRAAAFPLLAASLTRDPILIAGVGVATQLPASSWRCRPGRWPIGSIAGGSSSWPTPSGSSSCWG